ncbi:MAG TPA: maleylpyruvate isomerase family mycothiol-dependent enzyme [Actinomycetota bacterium]|nr:maleylpyruvate isomerase family mycothiol-dependent enzyme [Actinomycetota bacterium]
MDKASAYARVKERVVALVSEGNADTKVPTCPGWTVKDLIAHQADFLEVASTDPKGFDQDWGERGVQKRRGASLQDCLDEWDRRVKEDTDVFESQLAPVAVSDVLAHEQDIRSALAEPGGTDDENIVPSVEMALMFLTKKVESLSLPTLRVVSDEIDHTVGEGEPQATLRASTFELFRTLHGRRAPDQVRELQWEGEPGRWPDEIFIFGPTKKVVES